MTVIADHALGLTWTEEDAMARSAHALRDGDRVWLVDPFDHPDALARAADLGRPAGVLQLLDRHGRDCAAIAARLGVAHWTVGAPPPGDLPFTTLRVVHHRLWREVALWWPARRALVVAESLGTAPPWTLDVAPVGVHPMRRLLPPDVLRDLAPEHLLVGHGASLEGPDTTDAMRTAIGRSRRDAPRLLVRLPAMLRAAAEARR